MPMVQAKHLAHELTMEYIRERRLLDDPTLNNIPSKVELIADINKRFYDAIINNQTLDKLY